MPTRIEDVKAGVSGASEEKCRIVHRGDTLLMDAVTHFEKWQDLAAEHDIDLEVWEPDRITTNVWQVGRADREGIGFVVQPLMQMKVSFKRRENVHKAKMVIEDLFADAGLKYPVRDMRRVSRAGRRRKDRAVTLEISLPDPHYGLRAWGEEAGEDWDSDICARVFMAAVEDLLERADKAHRIDRVLFVTGNDFFNVNSMLNTTAKGTPQDEDDRYRKTFKEGRELLTRAIDTCRTVADVDVVVVPGNHDEERAFYLGHALECLYMKDSHVNVDNGPEEHKVVRIGDSLVGLTHGDKGSFQRLPLLMATNWADLWAQTSYHCWQLGHLHTAKQTTFSPSTTQDGVHIRWLPSLCPSSSWSAASGYIPYRMGIGILWGDKGPIGELVHRPAGGNGK